jgi:hypothetical protein
MNSITSHAIAIVLGGVIVATGCWWSQNKPRLPSVLATPSKEIAKEATSKLECKPILIYRDKVKEKLDLPDSVKTDTSKHVVNATKVSPSDWPITVSAVYDDQTGHIDLFKRQDQRPWIAFNRRSAVGIAYGINDQSDGFVTRLYGKLDLIQIKSISAGVLGDSDNSGGRFGGVFAEARF